MKRTITNTEIIWKEWSEDSFQEAKKMGKLILLDLTASWCHWCHVMDEKTYSDPDVARAINKDFVPIRVDIDKRPDVSERYNRGGFPTTAFLSDRGESIWGATFVPPIEMKRIIGAILRAKESGEIDRALERSRMQPLDMLKRARIQADFDTSEPLGIFEDIFSAYDVEYGGFGHEPKFPHPDVLDLLLMRYVETKDKQLADAVVNSLEKMISGLHDEAEGGLFRYSVTRDWHTPHYEKMLETNVGVLKNLVRAFWVIGNRGYDQMAKDIAGYLMVNLRDPESGGFYGSQDADEGYYKLPLESRKRRKAPSIDRTAYAGWNAEASAVFTLAGFVLADDDMLKAGKASWEHSLSNHWNPAKGLVRHVAFDDVYLFEDQASFFAALLAQLGASHDDSRIRLAEELIIGVNGAFGSDEGGFNDVMNVGNAIGELGTPRRPLVENSNWALALAKFGRAVHKPELEEQARGILDSFSQSEVEAHGVFAAAYLRARWTIDRGISAVEIHRTADGSSRDDPLLATVQTHFHPAAVPVMVPDDGATEPYAIVCKAGGCSRKLSDPQELSLFLRSIGNHGPSA